MIRPHIEPLQQSLRIPRRRVDETRSERPTKHFERRRPHVPEHVRPRAVLAVVETGVDEHVFVRNRAGRVEPEVTLHTVTRDDGKHLEDEHHQRIRYEMIIGVNLDRR